MKNLTDEFILKYKNNEVIFAKCGSKLVGKKKKATKMQNGGSYGWDFTNTTFTNDTPHTDYSKLRKTTAPIVGAPLRTPGMPTWASRKYYTRDGKFNEAFKNQYVPWDRDYTILPKDFGKFGIKPDSTEGKYLIDIFNKNQNMKVK